MKLVQFGEFLQKSGILLIICLVLQLLFTIALSPQHTTVPLPITSPSRAIPGKCMYDLLVCVCHDPPCMWSMLHLNHLEPSCVPQAVTVHL